MQSPLLGQWCEAVGCGSSVSDAALDRLLAAGHRADTWVNAKKIFAAVIAVLIASAHPLGERVPTLGGLGVVDDTFVEELSNLFETDSAEIISFLPRLMVANDPNAGIEMWRAVANLAPAGTDLLCIGAGAGLELVADSLAPDLGWSPGSRRGVDLAPIDVRDDASVRWLLGICPPDDPARFSRTRRAITAVTELDLKVESVDALEAVRGADSRQPVAVIGASILCMLTEPAALIDTIRSRPGVTYLVSDEVVAVHRAAGNADGLEQYLPGQRVVRAQTWTNGTVKIHR